MSRFKFFVVALPCMALCSCAMFLCIEYDKKPCIIPQSDYHFKTCEPFQFRVKPKVYYVPKGFDTDLASIPRWFWVLLPPQKTEFIAPAIIHDYLYRCPNGLTRYQADNVFYNALRKEGVGIYESLIMYSGVRIGGSQFFDKKRQKGCY
jgi:hypothetical protein